MPRERTSYKELRKSKRRHTRNITLKSELKTVIKKLEKTLAEKKTDEAKKIIGYVVSKIDKAASKGVIKKNTASRKISRLMKRLSGLAKA